MRRLLTVATVVVATLLVLVVTIAESWTGLETVADTGTALVLVLLLLTIGAAVVTLVGRRRDGGVSRAIVGVIAAASIVLVAAMAVVTVRGHTASARFAERADHLPLPHSYEKAPDAGVQQLESGRPEHVVRTWTAPAGSDACADATRAFEDWADAPFSTYDRGGGCVVSSTDQAEKALVHVTPDGTTVVLEMWLEGSSLLS